MIELIKENFNNEDNILFELSYEMYIKTKDKPDNFVIDFDKIYKWNGFSRKDNAKTTLLKNFEINNEYKISLPRLRERNLIKQDGNNK